MAQRAIFRLEAELGDALSEEQKQDLTNQIFTATENYWKEETNPGSISSEIKSLETTALTALQEEIENEEPSREGEKTKAYKLSGDLAGIAKEFAALDFNQQEEQKLNAIFVARKKAQEGIPEEETNEESGSSALSEVDTGEESELDKSGIPASSDLLVKFSKLEKQEFKPRRKIVDNQGTERGLDNQLYLFFKLESPVNYRGNEYETCQLIVDLPSSEPTISRNALLNFDEMLFALKFNLTVKIDEFSVAEAETNSDQKILAITAQNPGAIQETIVANSNQLYFNLDGSSTIEELENRENANFFFTYQGEKSFSEQNIKSGAKLFSNLTVKSSEPLRIANSVFADCFYFTITTSASSEEELKNINFLTANEVGKEYLFSINLADIRIGVYKSIEEVNNSYFLLQSEDDSELIIPFLVSEVNGLASNEFLKTAAEEFQIAIPSRGVRAKTPHELVAQRCKLEIEDFIEEVSLEGKQLIDEENKEFLKDFDSYQSHQRRDGSEKVSTEVKKEEILEWKEAGFTPQQTKILLEELAKKPAGESEIELIEPSPENIERIELQKKLNNLVEFAPGSGRSGNPLDVVKEKNLNPYLTDDQQLKFAELRTKVDTQLKKIENAEEFNDDTATLFCQSSEIGEELEKFFEYGDREELLKDYKGDVDIASAVIDKECERIAFLIEKMNTKNDLLAAAKNYYLKKLAETKAELTEETKKEWEEVISESKRMGSIVHYWDYNILPEIAEKKITFQATDIKFLGEENKERNRQIEFTLQPGTG
ncbi:8213_t:CDS:2 [Ambispora gerdemannii]|uniref:8213_t:CDS:1 n=1 Tax=Ambispora gerdemannii TaxID=144530 RepID=A0A9N9E233_9GLOM|nr:8213_t:CDS:2 [Ambispora gerdemannii]